MRWDRDLHRRLLLSARCQASHEEEDFADGPARGLHLQFELVEVPPEVGDPLVGQVLARPTFTEPLLELAELPLDPVQRQARRPVQERGRLDLLGARPLRARGPLWRRCLVLLREGLLEMLEAVPPSDLAAVQDRFEAAETVVPDPPRHAHRKEHHRGGRGAPKDPGRSPPGHPGGGDPRPVAARVRCDPSGFLRQSARASRDDVRSFRRAQAEDPPRPRRTASSQ